MPTYEWTCGEHDWEVMAPIAERNDPQACPVCGNGGRRSFSSAPVVAWFQDSTRTYKEKLVKGDPND